MLPNTDLSCRVVIIICDVEVGGRISTGAGDMESCGGGEEGESVAGLGDENGMDRGELERKEEKKDGDLAEGEEEGTAAGGGELGGWLPVFALVGVILEGECVCREERSEEIS